MVFIVYKYFTTIARLKDVSGLRKKDFARDLKRNSLRFFEEEMLVTRDHHKETSKSAKMFSAAAMDVFLNLWSSTRQLLQSHGLHGSAQSPQWTYPEGAPPLL
ncbi:uncharacterized protein LOC130997960 [Salvia miltiorrhiza]|uniref:uncharacterized protein LOC130997960 n=1 Tax=Salvia miltiorrhiza TaxID=226208 RepID=UPI0025AB95D6|nr:uncharacterized protein LOC130997960 [Salvia miltiorrhiza]XP_057779379.1 uncharacterized protein LOC130997960 [Salvia miltiorrhiza]